MNTFFSYNISPYIRWEGLPPLHIEEHNGIKVVRDDLVPGGTKRRFIYTYLLSYPNSEGFIYASPRQGYAQLALAYACKDLGKKCIIYLPKGERTDLTNESEKLGAEINEVPMGYLSNIQSKAKEREYKDGGKSKLIPFGFEDSSIINAAIEVCKEIPFTPNEIWSVLSSGVISRGLQGAFPNAKVYGVQVGHNPTQTQMGRAIVIPNRYPFSKECPQYELPPFPSSKCYDAKCWKHIMELGTKDGKTLFWNVGK